MANDDYRKVMTAAEAVRKKEIIQLLKKSGYVTFSKYFELTTLHLTRDPSVAGYMIPGEGIICLNATIDNEQIITVVKHEILHQVMNHMERVFEHVKKVTGVDLGEEKLSELSEEELDEIIHERMYRGRIDNIAGDLEISNDTYTDTDKKNIRGLRIEDANGVIRIFQGLVTEDYRDESWTKLTVEELWDKLDQELGEFIPHAVYGMMMGDVFIGGDGRVYGKA